MRTPPSGAVVLRGLAAMLFPLALAGCSIVRGDSSAEKPLADRDVTLTYQTAAARLATERTSSPLRAERTSSPLQTAAFTMATLQIKYPHPAGMPDVAQAVLILHTGDGDIRFGSRAFKERMQRLASSTSPADWPHGLPETLSIDLPRWQVEAIVSKLENSNYFRKQASVLNPEAYLAVELGGKSVGKKYRSVAELDALILDIRSHGRPAEAGSIDGLVRLPAVSRAF